MPHALQVSAATGGLTGALLTSVLRAFDQNPVFPPITCQDLQGSFEIHWPTLVLGVLLGLVLGQVLEGIILARHYLALRLRQLWWAYTNTLALKQRVA